MVYVSLIFIVLAAICNAVMDVLQWYESVFYKIKKDATWWNPNISWINKYEKGDPDYGRKKWILGLNYPVQLTDAWHLFKSLMIVFLCLSIVTFQDIYPKTILDDILIFCIFGTAWNVTFSLFYNKILRA
jgi:hypothetical protein